MKFDFLNDTIRGLPRLIVIVDDPENGVEDTAKRVFPNARICNDEVNGIKRFIIIIDNISEATQVVAKNIFLDPGQVPESVVITPIPYTEPIVAPKQTRKKTAEEERIARENGARKLWGDNPDAVDAINRVSELRTKIEALGDNPAEGDIKVLREKTKYSVLEWIDAVILAKNCSNQIAVDWLDKYLAVPDKFISGDGDRILQSLCYSSYKHLNKIAKQNKCKMFADYFYNLTTEEQKRFVLTEVSKIAGENNKTKKEEK